MPFNPEKVATLGKVITIGEEMKSYRVVGKVAEAPEPMYSKGALINAHLHTFVARVYDEEKSAGMIKFWESIVGYSKR